jgi:tRNA nucleotidyltransferase/poly(A) polymerase
MSLKQLLKTVQELSVRYKIDKPYIVGGIPRDIYLKIPNIKTTDVDITTNSNDSLRLAVLFADKINEVFEVSDDGHVTVFADKYDVDFSSNFISSRVKDYFGDRLKNKLLLEVYSRDFTLNTLHQDLVTGNIFDPTKQGFKDIKNKIIKTPVPPEITLRDDPRRIYRAINLAARYNFNLDPELIKFTKSNIDLFTSKNIKDKYATVKLNKALIEDEQKTIDLLKELGLFKIVPLAGRFKELLISKKYLYDYFSE